MGTILVWTGHKPVFISHKPVWTGHKPIFISHTPVWTGHKPVFYWSHTGLYWLQAGLYWFNSRSSTFSTDPDQSCLYWSEPVYWFSPLVTQHGASNLLFSLMSIGRLVLSDLQSESNGKRSRRAFLGPTWDEEPSYRQYSCLDRVLALLSCLNWLLLVSARLHCLVVFDCSVLECGRRWDWSGLGGACVLRLV
ncbi:unnamed protein product [Boreogadus saida]